MGDFADLVSSAPRQAPRNIPKHPETPRNAKKRQETPWACATRARSRRGARRAAPTSSRCPASSARALSGAFCIQQQ